MNPVAVLTISTEEAKEMLNPLGLSIGGWNEIIDIQHSSEHYMCQPPRLASELYVFCQTLVQWLSFDDRTLVQFDNSTSPLEDEIEIVQNIFSMNVSDKVGANTSFIIDGNELHSKMVVLIFFVIVFEWHVHVVSANSKYGKRLSLQDGVVYFFGSIQQLKDARDAMEEFKSNPLAIGQKGR